VPLPGMQRLSIKNIFRRTCMDHLLTNLTRMNLKKKNFIMIILILRIFV
jgi:hypothetical protein